MSSKIYAQQGKVAIVAGLNWSALLKEGKARPGEIRSHASEADASKIVVVENAARAAVGLYAPAEIEFDDDDNGGPKVVKPRVMHSLAALFAAKIGDGNAVLALSLPITGSVSQAVVIVIEGGVPLIDQVKSTEEAQSLAMSYAGGSMGLTYGLFTNDLDSFPAGEAVQDDELWALCSKTTLLGPRPANVMALLGVVVVLALIGAGGYGFVQFKHAQERKERARLAALANPTPKYESALAAQIHVLGLNRDATQAVLARLREQPLWVKGWLLSKAECTVESGACVSTWARAGGTTDDLIAARRSAGEEIAGDSTLNLVHLNFKVDLPLSGVVARRELPTMAESVIGSTPIFQVWENARIVATVGGDGYKAWPQVPGLDMSSVSQDVIIKARPIEIKAGSVLVSEVVASAPANFWWSSVTFEVKVGNKALDSLSAQLKGKSYVR